MRQRVMIVAGALLVMAAVIGAVYFTQFERQMVRRAARPDALVSESDPGQVSDAEDGETVLEVRGRAANVETGEPLAGALVWGVRSQETLRTFVPTTRAHRSGVYTVAAGDDGTFVLPLPNGGWESVGCYAPGHATATNPLPANADGVLRIDFLL
jgi:hypothetical protein